MIKETEMMEEFLSSFGDEGWKVNEKGKLSLESDDGKNSFNFIDYGNFCKEIKIREINLRLNNDFYRLMEYPLESGPVYIFVMPSDNEEMGQGTLYNSDGELNRDGNLVDLPSKIDMEKTAELFIKQVIDKKFAVPELVKLEK